MRNTLCLQKMDKLISIIVFTFVYIVVNLITYTMQLIQ